MFALTRPTQLRWDISEHVIHLCISKLLVVNSITYPFPNTSWGQWQMAYKPKDPEFRRANIMLTMRPYGLTDACWLVTDFTRALRYWRTCLLVPIWTVWDSPNITKETEWLSSLLIYLNACSMTSFTLSSATIAGWSWVCCLGKCLP